MYFYFSLFHNFNFGRLKEKSTKKLQQMIQLVSKQIHKLIFMIKKIHKKRKY